MFKNKLVSMAIIILIAITLLGVVTFLIWKFVFQEPVEGEAHKEEVPIEAEPLPAQDMAALIYETVEYTTDLVTQNVIRIKFTIQTDSEPAKLELELRKFQLDNIIINLLSAMSKEDLKGPEGINALEAQIMLRMNELMQDGKIVRIYTTNKILQ
jgi:flagellar FliL protein